MKPVVLVALWLWPSSLLAFPTFTVLPDEEQNLNHYVQILQNLVMSVPTREQDFGEKAWSSSTVDVAEPRSSSTVDVAEPRSSSTVDVAEPRSSTTVDVAEPRSSTTVDVAEPRSSTTVDVAEPRSSTTVDVAEPRSLPSEGILTPGFVSSQEITPETDVMVRTIEEKTTFPPTGFIMGMERRRRTTTAFWSVRPNNISIVLHTDEPYIEKEPEGEPESRLLTTETEPEPEPEPETGPQQMSESEEELETSTPPNKVHAGTSQKPFMLSQPTRITITAKTTSSMDISTDSEDVPQLSGQSEIPDAEDFSGHHSLSTRYNNILRKIYNINSQIQQGLLGDNSNPEYQEFIKDAREHLKRSLALAAAAEHKLQQMYESDLFPEGRGSDRDKDDMEMIINMLYNSRSKLSDYFNIKHVPSELRKKTAIVIAMLKKVLCVDQVKMQSLVRRVLNNNMKILNILNVP